MDSDVALPILLGKADHLKRSFPHPRFHRRIDHELWAVVGGVYAAGGGVRRPAGFLLDTEGYGRIVGFNLQQLMALGN